MKEKYDFGFIMGVIGIISLLFAIIISQGNRNAVPVNQQGSVDSMHSSSSQNRNITNLSDLVGKPMPSFSLTDKNGNTYSSDNLKGKNVVLFFNEGLMCYPACWNQIASLSQDDRLKNDNTVALSVVVDSKDSWQGAINKMPALANATVLFDTNTSVSKSLGMLNTASSMHFGSLPGHSYVLVDKDGIIRHVFDDPNMAIHNDQLVQEIAKLKS